MTAEQKLRIAILAAIPGIHFWPGRRAVKNHSACNHPRPGTRDRAIDPDPGDPPDF